MESISSLRSKDKKKRKISEVIDVERVIKDFRRRSEEDAASLRIPWKKLSDLKSVGTVTETNGEVHFVTGSKYMGAWDETGMSGVGRYTMPHGAIFEGELRDGVFHGHGTLEWPQKQRIDGVWLCGKLQEKRYTFSDGLVFQEKDWSYCRFPDRRFFQCIKEGLNPAGKCLKTARQPTPVMLPSCYDTGDGIFNPNTWSVSSYELPDKVLRIPKNEDTNWIMENCRKGSSSPDGYQPLFNENWSNDPPNLPYSLPMSDDSPQTWWKRLSTFERDVEVEVNKEPVLGGEDISQEPWNCYEVSSWEESFYSSSSEGHCPCIKDKKYETDIEKEEYAAFREIISNEWGKYDDLDLSKTNCTSPQSREASFSDFLRYKSEISSESDLSEEKFEVNSSNLSLEKKINEMEKLKILDETAIKASILTENKVNMEDDERMKKGEIEKAEEELEEIMMKSRDEEILEDSSEQEMDQKNKSGGSAENEDKLGKDAQKENEEKEETREVQLEESDLSEAEKLKGLGANEDRIEDISEQEKLKNRNNKEDKEDEKEKSKTDHLEETEESEDIGENKKARKDQFKPDIYKTVIIKNLKGPEDKTKVDHLEATAGQEIKDQEEALQFSAVFEAPRSKLEFVRKPCDPKICSKYASEGCSQFSGNRVPSCKSRRAIEMVHLRVPNKNCHK
ncbi:uncharacterized protein LOC117171622 [Belonocnema kinseyi]|uniref:uncharacterized protein LOC117171622 n=1 Tax=Belonocnema kinseyi TaxID=2817044 RepID=UPI00143CFDD6|nr:uncharacterized protein LOC117171622 [Belonocnema kinseyi]